MFVFKMNFRVKPLVLTILAALAVSAVICVTTAATRSVPADSTSSESTGKYSLVIKSGGEANFLSQLGLETSGGEISEETVVIPSNFNKYYDEYNELQKQIGLDLSKFKGKEVKKLTVPLAKPENYSAVLLVYKNRVIGGHLTSGIYGDKNISLAG